MKTVAFALVGAFTILMTTGAVACDKQTKDGVEVSQGTSVQADATKGKAPSSFDAPPKPGVKAFCPVMKAEFVVKKDSARSEYKGKHYVFCCPGCKPQFDANPAKFI